MRPQTPEVLHLLCTACILLLGSAELVLARTAVNLATDCPRKRLGLERYRDGAIATASACPSVINERSPPSRVEPWSHLPLCAVGTTNQGEDAEFCVYTATHFGSHGVSIVARPETAQRGAEVLESIYHSTFPSRETVRELNTDNAFEIVDVPGKGKGIVAKRHIPKYETFMIDYAALVLDAEFMRAVPQDDKRRLLNAAASQLAIPEVLTSLAASGMFETDVVEDVMNTNEFNSEFAQVANKVVFPTISVSIYQRLIHVS
jgi:hypothetical protein